MTDHEQKAAALKHRLRMQGSSLRKWAAENGYPIHTVYTVVQGSAKATYGKAHEVAVKLGLKDPDELAQ